MKVLHIVPTLSTASLQYGGPSVAVVEMCKELRRHGIAVTIATTHDKGVNAGSFSGMLGDNAGVTVHYFPKVLSGILPSGFAFSPALKKWLNQHVNEFDLVNVHTIFNYPSTQGCIAAIRYNVPYLLRTCGMLDRWSLRRSRLKKKIWMLLYGLRIINRASALHFTSEEESKALDTLRIKAAGVVLPIGVAQNENNLGLRQSILGSRLEQFADKKKILFLSRIHPKKGLDLLIPALGRLAKKRDDFIFILAGTGELKHLRRVKRLLNRHDLKGRTVITGFVEGGEKSAVFSLSDMFVLPSYQENFGLAVAEALSYGLAVVISNQVNICHDVSSYNAGIVTACNTGEIALGIEKLLEDDTLRKKMGENAKRLVYEKFNWGIIIPRLIKAYSQVLAKTEVGLEK